MKLLRALFFLALSASPAFAATDYYLSSGITTNCSAKSTSPGYIGIETFAISGTDPVSSSGSSGKLMLGDFTIEKSFDDCSGVLVTQFLQGRAIPTVTLTGIHMTGNSGPAQTIMTITLTNAVIDSYTLSHDEETPKEDLNFRYQTICINSTPADGSTPTNVCYNSSTNQVSH